MVQWFDPAQAEGITPYENLGVLGKVGLILQNVADPNTLPQYNQAVNRDQAQRLQIQQQNEQVAQQSALKQLASDPSFASLDPATQYQQIAAITGDPSALAQFNASQTISPLQQQQLALQRQQVGIAQQAAAAKQNQAQQQQRILGQLFGGQGAAPSAENLIKYGAITNNPTLIGLGNSMMQQDTANQTKVDNQVTTYAKEVEPLAAVVPALSSSNSILAKYNNMDIPGVGATGNVPMGLLSDEGKEVRQSIQTVGNQILAALSGKAVSDGEAQRMANSIGFNINGDGKLVESANLSDKQLLKGINDVTDQLSSKIMNSSTILSPEAMSTYKERGGTVYPGALAKMTQSVTVKTTDDYNALPSGTTYTDPSGKQRVKK